MESKQPPFETEKAQGMEPWGPKSYRLALLRLSSSTQFPKRSSVRKVLMTGKLPAIKLGKRRELSMNSTSDAKVALSNSADFKLTVSNYEIGNC
jgi:hypothetical protein